MAEHGQVHCEQKWNQIFKKCLGKSSRKYYRRFLLDLLAISLGLKQSFLFDYAVLDMKNASDLMDAFVEAKLLARPLDVIQVGDDVFFADLQFLIGRLRKSLEENLFVIVDVSENLQEPIALSGELQSQVMSELKLVVDFLEQYGKEMANNSVFNQSQLQKTNILKLEAVDKCSMPCLFGFLLGYPVIYWCNPVCDHNCLSLVTLNRYTVTMKVMPLITHSSMLQNHQIWILGGIQGMESCDHLVFSFTAPVSLRSSIFPKVQCWMNEICNLGEALGITDSLEHNETTVTFSQVTL